MNKPIRIKLKATGEIITARNYSNGAIDVKGNFYHHKQYIFVGYADE